jgi:acyl carrier protein
MTQDEIKALLFELIGEIAPEADPTGLSENEHMRSALDLDSMDFNNLIIAIHERKGRNIREADYNKLFTLKGAIVYLAAPSGEIKL